MSAFLVMAINFKRTDLKRPFLVCRYIFGKSRSFSCIEVKVRVTGAKKACLCMMFARGLASIEGSLVYQFTAVLPFFFPWLIRTLGASHESPLFVSVFDHHY